MRLDGTNLAIGTRSNLSSALGGPGRRAFGLMPAGRATVPSRLSTTVAACLCAAVAGIASLSTTVAACLCAAVAGIAGLSTTVAACLCATVAGIAGLSTTVAACLCAAVAGIAGLSTTVAGRLTSSAARASTRSTIVLNRTARSAVLRGSAGPLAGVSAMLRWGSMLRRGCVLCRSGMGCRCAASAFLLRRSDCSYGENHQQYGPFGQNILLSVARIHSHSCEM
jgi:hypothetical protein